MFDLDKRVTFIMLIFSFLFSTGVHARETDRDCMLFNKKMKNERVGSKNQLPIKVEPKPDPKDPMQWGSVIVTTGDNEQITYRYDEKCGVDLISMATSKPNSGGGTSTSYIHVTGHMCKQIDYAIGRNQSDVFCDSDKLDAVFSQGSGYGVNISAPERTPEKLWQFYELCKPILSKVPSKQPLPHANTCRAISESVGKFKFEAFCNKRNLTSVFDQASGYGVSFDRSERTPHKLWQLHRQCEAMPVAEFRTNSGKGSSQSGGSN
ncbi:MAG: hypothetical protein KDD50_10320 [Bdellovibrionales bacterium]|nr:hypothetical protein [Bdellovibrionales bacterium]